MNESIGERIIHAIIESRLLKAECPDSPDSPILIKWSANAGEQITTMVHKYIGLYDPSMEANDIQQ